MKISTPVGYLCKQPKEVSLNIIKFLSSDFKEGGNKSTITNRDNRGKEILQWKRTHGTKAQTWRFSWLCEDCPPFLSKFTSEPSLSSCTVPFQALTKLLSCSGPNSDWVPALFWSKPSPSSYIIVVQALTHFLHCSGLSPHEGSALIRVLTKFLHWSCPNRHKNPALFRSEVLPSSFTFLVRSLTEFLP